MTYHPDMQPYQAKQHRRRLDKRHWNPAIVGVVIMLTVLAVLFWR